MIRIFDVIKPEKLFLQADKVFPAFGIDIIKI